MVRVLKSIVSSVLAASVGLVAVLIVGMLWWNAGRGLPGITIGAFTAACSASFFRRRFDWSSSALAASIGAGVASYLAIAFGEVIAPGSGEWALKGGLYGATIGLPISAILGPVGAIRNDASANASSTVEEFSKQ